MSIYNVNKICYLAEHDVAFRDRMRQDPSHAIGEFELSEEERYALLQGDVATLHQLGAVDYLLGHLRRHQIVGLTRDIYKQRMKAVR